MGKILTRFEEKGYKCVTMKVTTPGKEHLEKHYADLSKKGFFPGLIEYMTSGPVCAMVWEGDNAVAAGRKMLGATKPFDSEPGTIRGDFCIDVGRNICHGSDSVESANNEIKLWFPNDKELNAWEHHSHKWIYEWLKEGKKLAKAKNECVCKSLVKARNECVSESIRED